MKIILLQDVAKVGKRYEVKEVKSGLARNFLIPKNLAEIATDEKISRFNKLKEKIQEDIKIKGELLEKNIKFLSDKTVTIRTKSDEIGNLFAGIHEKDITSQLKKNFGIDIDYKNIILKEPIKKISQHKITVNSGAGETYFTLIVEKE